MLVRGPETLGCRAVGKDLYISGESAKAVLLVLPIGYVEPGSDISLVAAKGRHALEAELVSGAIFQTSLTAFQATSGRKQHPVTRGQNPCRAGVSQGSG